METIFISVYRKDLEEIGVEQKEEWASFYFNPKHLTGYWVVNDDDGSPIEIMMYIGGNKFIAQYDEETIKMLNNLIKEE